jgi:hypothetical protein
MRRLPVFLSLAAIGFVLLVALPQLGASQLDGVVSSDSIEPNQVKMEIAALKMINELEMSREQIESLLGHISEIRSGREFVLQAELDLRDFLVGFNGSREEYRDAIKPFEESIDQAEESYHNQIEASMDELRDIFSMRQGDILRGHSDTSFDGQRVMRAFPGNRIVIPNSFNHHGSFHMNYDSEEVEEALEQFEFKMEMLGDRMGELGERLGESFGRVFRFQDENNWDFDFDFDSDWDWDSDESGFEIFNLPNVHIEINRNEMMMHGMFSEFIFEHLDVLEKILLEKLDMLAPASAPLEEQGEESSVL